MPCHLGYPRRYRLHGPPASRLQDSFHHPQEAERPEAGCSAIRRSSKRSKRVASRSLRRGPALSEASLTLRPGYPLQKSHRASNRAPQQTLPRKTRCDQLPPRPGSDRPTPRRTCATRQRPPAPGGSGQPAGPTSATTRVWACAARDCFQLSLAPRPPGGMPACSSTDRIVVAATLCPSLRSSPFNSKVIPAWVLFRHAHDQLPAFS